MDDVVGGQLAECTVCKKVGMLWVAGKGVYCECFEGRCADDVWKKALGACCVRPVSALWRVRYKLQANFSIVPDLLHSDIKSMQVVGYKQILDYF